MDACCRLCRPSGAWRRWSLWPRRARFLTKWRRGHNRTATRVDLARPRRNQRSRPLSVPARHAAFSSTPPCMTWARGRRLRSDWWSASRRRCDTSIRTSHGGGAGSRARAVAARRPAAARRYSHLGLRGGRILGHRPGTDGAVGAERARTDAAIGNRRAAHGAQARSVRANPQYDEGRRDGGLRIEARIGDDQNAAIGCLRDRRNPTKPRPAKPASIIAQVEGSGADDGRAPLKRLSLCSSPPPEKLAANTEPEM